MNSRPHYRPEVDGLRALAVLGVIGYHAGAPMLRGGFAGVDVFFVISGYLITRLLAAEFDTGRFSFARFYERRARRLLPALLLVLGASLPAAWAWLPPGDAERHARSLIATLAFVPNVLAWRETGYFETAAALDPLLHTWSLGVEEQFYLAYPALLLLAWKLRARWRIAAITGATLASFALAQWAAVAHAAAAFYLPPTRAWELGVGALIALCPTAADRDARKVAGLAPWLAFAGVAMILTSFVLHHAAMRYPSTPALLPVLGTALAIRFASLRDPIGRLLALRPLVGLGLISYGLYLWHQPLFAFARQRALDDRASEPGAMASALIVLIALLLAYSTWRWLERPCRDASRVTRASLLRGVILVSALLVCGAFALRHARTSSDALPPNIAHATFLDQVSALGPVCHSEPFPDHPGLIGCTFGARDAIDTVVLFGDSHAMALSHAIEQRLTRTRRRGIWVRLEDCPPVPYLYDATMLDRANACDERFARLRAWLRAQPAELVLAFRWSFQLHPVPGEIDTPGFDNAEGGRELLDPRPGSVARDTGGRMTTDASAKSAALARFVTELSDAATRTHLVYPIPETGWDVARLNWVHWHRHGTVLPELSFARADYERRNRFVSGVLDALGDRPDLHRVRPADVLCGPRADARCMVQADGVPYYVDFDHLTAAGADLVTGRIFATE